MKLLIQIATYSTRIMRLAAVMLLVGVLAACTGTDSTLGLGNGDNAQNAEPLPNPPAGGSNVYLAPIVGAPVDKVEALSARLSDAAPEAQIRLTATPASNITHEVRGFFSAFSEGNTTTVVHVWDIFTPQGQRIHRIQGQQSVTGAAADPWSVVTDATMQTIADQMLNDYQSWRNNQASASR